MRYLLHLLFLLPTLVFAQKTYYVSAPKANIYSLPSTTSSVLVSLNRGDEIQYLKTMESGAWVKVQKESNIGYMEISSIKEGTLEQKIEKAESKKYHVTVFQSAIYAKPNFSSGKLKTLSQNEIVEIIGDGQEWGKVKMSTGIGYIFMAHVEEGLPKKEKAEKEVKVQYYTAKLSGKIYSKADKSSSVVKSVERGDNIQVVKIEGTWAKVQLDRGFGYAELANLEKEKVNSGGSGSGSNVKMKDIGKSKNPTKFGAICRDGSTDYTVGPHTCSKGNGVKMWIYKTP